MSRILVCCEQGNNRSVTVAHHLKYLGHDCIPAGTKTNTQQTLQMLVDWADHIILTDSDQAWDLPDQWNGCDARIHVWPIGPDVFPRPFNPTLKRIVRKMVDERRGELTEPVRAAA